MGVPLRRGWLPVNSPALQITHHSRLYMQHPGHVQRLNRLTKRTNSTDKRLELRSNGICSPSSSFAPATTGGAQRARGNDSLSTRLPSNTSKASRARKVLISFDQLPEWHQDNEYILHSYRPISGSALVSFCSWLYIHNESVNIYSHLIPAIVFLLGEWYVLEYLRSRYANITGSDFFIFGFFLLTAVICLGLSTTYHTLMNHSYGVEQLWLRLDLVGIVVLTLGDFVSGIYMVFWCEPLQRTIYWSMVSQHLYTNFYFSSLV